MSLLNYKGYTGSVEFSQEDNCLYGKVLGMKKDCISYEGETVSELVSDFEGAVDEYPPRMEAYPRTQETPVGLQTSTAIQMES